MPTPTHAGGVRERADHGGCQVGREDPGEKERIDADKVVQLDQKSTH
jgi:hypothetical protein